MRPKASVKIRTTQGTCGNVCKSLGEWARDRSKDWEGPGKPREVQASLGKSGQAQASGLATEDPKPGQPGQGAVGTKLVHSCS